MLQPVYLVAAHGTGQLTKVRQHPIGGADRELVLEALEQLVVLAGAVRHAGEAHRRAVLLIRAVHACERGRGRKVVSREGLVCAAEASGLVGHRDASALGRFALCCSSVTGTRGLQDVR